MEAVPQLNSKGKWTLKKRTAKASAVSAVSVWHRPAAVSMQPAISAAIWMTVSAQGGHMKYWACNISGQGENTLLPDWCILGCFPEKCLIDGRKNQRTIRTCGSDSKTGVLPFMLPCSPFLLGLFGCLGTMLLVLASGEMLVKGCLTPWPRKFSRLAS